MVLAPNPETEGILDITSWEPHWYRHRAQMSNSPLIPGLPCDSFITALVDTSTAVHSAGASVLVVEVTIRTFISAREGSPRSSHTRIWDTKNCGWTEDPFNDSAMRTPCPCLTASIPCLSPSTISHSPDRSSGPYSQGARTSGARSGEMLLGREPNKDHRQEELNPKMMDRGKEAEWTPACEGVPLLPS